MSNTIETNKKAPADSPESPAPRRLTVHVPDAGRAVIRRAITLRLALRGEVGSDDTARDGSALAEIASQWLQTQGELLREAR